MMETDLLSHSRARFNHEAARRVLKEKYEAKMLFAYRGGMWRAGSELLSTLNNCRIDDKAEVVLLDLYETPVKIQTQELWDLAAGRWQEQMTAWLVDFEQLSQQR
jgi:hypothetical protein